MIKVPVCLNFSIIWFINFAIFFDEKIIFIIRTIEHFSLQIRDGDQGYSKLINKYCGSKFPPIITSSGRSLWLRFVSDGTIEYSGFKAVYDYIPNPMEIVPFIPKCEFEIGGNMDYLGKKFTNAVLAVISIVC